MPPNMLPTESPHDKSDDPQRSRPGPRTKGESKRCMGHHQHEKLQPEVIPGQRPVSVEYFGPAVGDSPRWKACGPAVRAFDFDFNSRKRIRRRQDESAENQMLHRINPIMFTSLSADVSKVVYIPPRHRTLPAA